jgi:protein phosphatase
VAYIHDDVLHTCHVGDSRVYVVNESGIEQITNDHSSVWELVRAGQMTREEARHSPLKNQISQALGSPYPVVPEYNQHLLNKGDNILLCSDGLWDMLSDAEIHQVVIEGGSLKKSCEGLIEKANEAGGEDNITVVLVQVERWSF